LIGAGGAGAVLIDEDEARLGGGLRVNPHLKGAMWGTQGYGEEKKEGDAGHEVEGSRLLGGIDI